MPPRKNEDGVNGWPNRAALNASTIKRHAPDLIGFQELQPGNSETYRVELPEYGYVTGPKYTNREPFMYPSVFWKESRFELVDSGGFWLSRTPDRFSRDWGTAYVRSVTWVNLRDAQTGLGLTHWNTHLDSVSEVARVEGARLVLQEIRRIRAADTPVIVTGDFNSEPGSPVYQLFLQHGFLDTFLSAGNEDSEDTFTFHRFKGEGHPTVRMDWILTLDGVQRIRTWSCTIARDNRHPLYPSDHYPVVAELEILG